MPKGNSLDLPGGHLIAHDHDMVRYIYQVVARMVFPRQDKDKGKRNRFLNHLGAQKSQVKKPDPQSMMEDEIRERNKGCVAGEAFMLQIMLSFKWDTAPSMRFLEYAVKQGLVLNEHNAVGYPVKQLRPIYNKFGSVKHLWCADSFMKSVYSENGEPLKLKHCEGLLKSPGSFFGLAEAIRFRAKEIGLIFRKDELWMPTGWHDVAESFELKELNIGITEALDKRWRKLEKLEEWYRQQKKWIHSPKKI